MPSLPASTDQHVPHDDRCNDENCQHYDLHLRRYSPTLRAFSLISLLLLAKTQIREDLAGRNLNLAN